MAYENVILILVAVGLIFFGSKKLPELFKSLGRAQVEYEKAKIESKNELSRTGLAMNQPELRKENESDLSREKLEEMASKLGIDENSNISDVELKEKILERIRHGT
jgi:sec-independent protein translocase protein TatA